MVTDDSYTCGDHSITYGVVESLCLTPETNVTLCVNYIQSKNKVLQVSIKNSPLAWEVSNVSAKIHLGQLEPWWLQGTVKKLE